MLRNLLFGKFSRKLTVVPPEPERLHQCLERLGALRASVYLYREERFFLSAIQDFNEYLEPLELPADVDDATLGEALIDRLRAFDPVSPVKAGGMKDWRVLQVSKARSGRAFNAQALFVYVESVNAALIFRACPRDSRHAPLYAGIDLGVGATPAQMGATIRTLLQAVRDLRAAGAF